LLDAVSLPLDEERRPSGAVRSFRHAVRHNLGMAASPIVLSTVLLSCIYLLTGCDNAGPSTASGTAPSVAPTGNIIEFRGQRACVDCLGIEAWLRLEQRGDESRYTLVEIYRADGGARRFEETGQWESTNNLLRLRAAEGGERVYTLLPDNRLQAVDTRGQAVPSLADEVLDPISYSNER